MVELVLIRGLPGSGKSTMAAKMAKELGYVHLETDMYLVVDNQYRFDGSKLCAAHKWCEESANKALSEGKSVIVSNTFCQLWEMKTYMEFGYPCRIIKAEGTWGNTHGVPDSVLMKMKKNWEEFI